MPNFLIVGSPKCGTTSLAAWLAAHPEAYLAEEKEVHFFNRSDRWELGLEWYAERFARAGDAKAVGEATPSYMFGPRTVERIAETLPEVRCIACLRNPVDRALSHYHHWRDRRTVERRTFAEAVDDELGGRDAARAVPGFPGYDPAVPSYLAHGRYADLLERLAGHVGRDRVHVVLLDDLEQHPQEAFAGVCRFLGIDDTVVPERVGSKENAAFAFRPAWLWRLLVRNKDRLPGPLAKFIALHAFRKDPEAYAPMEPEVRARLEQHFAEPNARLAAWLGRDLPAGWSTTPDRAGAVVA